jgi:outer membrane protein TolC
VAALLAGCQGYERAPLNLDAHAAALGTRVSSPEALREFVDRLAETGQPAPECFDYSDGLSPAEGEVLALFYNPDLRLARLDAGIALATFETAGLWEDPRFGFDAAEILSPSGPFEYGLTLSFTLPVSGRLAVEKDRAGAAFEAELRRIVDAEWALRAEVRSAWAAWTAAAERVRLLEEINARIEHITSITDRLEHAGGMTRVESRLIRAEALSVRSGLIAGQWAETDARIRLLGLMGLPPDAGIELLAVFPTAEIPRVEDETRRLIESNTTLAVHRAEYQIAEETLRLEVRRQYPDITIGGGYGDEGDDRLLLGISLPIPVLNANRAGIREARARRERVRAAAETAFERLALDLASAHAARVVARLQRESIEAELVPMLDEQSRELERLAGLGEVDALVLLETVTRGYEARSLLLDLRRAELAATNEVARLLGPDRSRDPEPAPAAHEPAAPSVESPAEEAHR